VAFGQSLTPRAGGNAGGRDARLPDAAAEHARARFRPRDADALRRVGLSTPTNNQVASYTFAAGAWQLTQSPTVQNLRNLALSLDRTRLVALTDTSILELSPASLVMQATTAPQRQYDGA
jgi:hypothetical protein